MREHQAGHGLALAGGEQRALQREARRGSVGHEAMRHGTQEFQEILAALARAAKRFETGERGFHQLQARFAATRAKARHARGWFRHAQQAKPAKTLQHFAKILLVPPVFGRQFDELIGFEIRVVEREKCHINLTKNPPLSVLQKGTLPGNGGDGEHGGHGEAGRGKINFFSGRAAFVLLSAEPRGATVRRGVVGRPHFLLQMIDAPDWDLLHGLFGGEAPPPFRHRMGLRRNITESADAFYFSTSPSCAVLTEKQAILDGPAASLYRLISPEGDAVLREWAEIFLGELPLTTSEDEAARIANHRAVTLACEPDLLLLRPPHWELVWASVCFPTRWSLVGKLHRPLREIHAAVPDLNATLGRQIDVFFARLAPGQSWQRANWGLAASAQRNQHPSLPLPGIWPDVAPADLFLRIERQQFFKLPVSSALAFGIRIAIYPLDAVLADAAIRCGLREKLRTMPRAVSAYKGIPPDWWQTL